VSADWDTDEARDARRARLLQAKPKAAESSMQERAFRAAYMSHHIVDRTLLSEFEEQEHVLFCPACRTDFNPVMVKARVLHISYQEDDLRNFPAIAHCHCNGCGWEEMIPVVPPVVSDGNRTLARRYLTAQQPANVPYKAPANNVFSSAVEDMSIMPRPVVLKFSRSQQVANRAWDAVRKDEETLQHAAHAEANIEVIESIEADAKKANARRAVAKNAALGMAYGMSQAQAQAKMSDMLNGYAQQAGAALAQKLDRSILGQLCPPPKPSAYPPEYDQIGFPVVDSSTFANSVSAAKKKLLDRVRTKRGE
jgi:hypothetical protein